MNAVALCVEQALNGLALGALYALFGMALWLGLTAGGVVNLALAGVATLAAMAGLTLMTGLALPFLLGLVVAGLAGAMLGAALELAAFQPLRSAAGAPPPAAGLIAALAAWFVLDGLAVVAIGARHPAVPPASLPSGQLRFGGVDVPTLQLIVLLVLAVAGVALARLLYRTRFGIALRATAENADVASMAGVDVPAALVGAGAVAGGLCGIAGLLGAASTANLSPGLGAGLGALLVLKGLTAAVAGRRWGLWGVLAAGLALGVLEVACTIWNAFALRDALAFALLLALLLFAPGSFGVGRTERTDAPPAVGG